MPKKYSPLLPRPTHRPTAPLALCALAAAIAGASACLFLHNPVFADNPAATQIAAPAVAGEPGEAPKPKSLQPGAMMDRTANVYVGDSFAAVDQLRDANRYADQGQNKLAIQAYQKILNDFGQKLVYLNNDSYVSITDYVRAKLLAMPAVKDGMYDQIVGLDADSAIKSTLANRDLAGLIRACDRYFPATAALNGLSQAAQWYFERGEFAGAARTWQLLATHPMATPDQKALFLFRAAVAESLAGNTSAAKSLHDRLAKDYPDASGPVAGQNASLITAAGEFLALPPLIPQADSPDEWPAFMGGPAHSRLLHVDSSIGARLWSVDLNDQAVTGEKNNPHEEDVPNGPAYGQQVQPDPNYQALNAYPVLSNGTLFIDTGDRVVAMSINAGTPLWGYPEHPQLRMDIQQRQMMRNMYGGAMHGPVSHDSVAVSRDQVFAILPAPAAPAAADGRARQRVYYGPQFALANTRIVCLNRSTGAELWSTPAQNVKTEKAGNLTFCGSPIVTHQGVFAMARKIGEGSFTELYLVRLDRDTGSPTWSCYLCSASSGTYYAPTLNPGPIPIPTIVDDVVYISTGQGADCAVDANAGRILWLEVNDTAKHALNPNQMYNPNFHATPSWKFNPPLVSGDKVITCETTDSDALLRIYNRWTGQTLRSLTKKDLGVSNMDILAGIVDDKAIVVGNNVFAVDLNNKSDSPAWTVDFPLRGECGDQLGRPFLAADYLYVPFENGLLLVDVHKGSTKSFWLWPKTEKDVPGKPGNLLVTSEQVVVLNDAEIAGYSKWETARDNRLAKIKQHPADPEAYLALAEISFRTNHFDLAQENMQRAVQLACAPTANTPEAGGGQAPPEIVGRLYRTNLNFAQQLLVNLDIPTRDRARFYYDQCKLAARDPEQQAEWRLCMSDLSLAQKKTDEAAALYNQILTDPALRSAPYKRADALARAGVIAEDKFRALIDHEPNGKAVYQRYEDQAAAIVHKAQATSDKALLAQVIDSYPNSAAAVEAASSLASAARDSHDPAQELKALYWLLPRTAGDKKAQVTADTALACLALPKPRYASAMAWTQRGLRAFKDYKWTDPATNQPMTFASLRDQIRANPIAAVAEGRAPILPPAVKHKTPDGTLVTAPDMDPASAAHPLAVGTLLAPVEQSSADRRPDLLFVLHSGALHIFNTAHHTELTKPQARNATGEAVLPDGEGGLPLPDNQPTVLVGCVGDTAVLAQAKMAIGINLKNPAIAWTVPFNEENAEGDAAAQNNGGIRFRGAINRRIVVNGGIVIVNNGMMIDQRTGQVINAGANDPEMARQISFATLGRPSFNTLRIINDKLVRVVGDKLFSYNVQTGKPQWADASGNPLAVTLPGPGLANVVTGNEDVLVAEIDAPNRSSADFVVIDADSGKFLKQFKMQEGEHVEWRGISEDGIFFVVSNRAVAAYDLHNDNALPLWRRTDLTSSFPNATLVTLDGLIFVKGADQILCLSSDGGEVRWPVAGSEPIHFGIPVAAPGQRPFLTSALLGDRVVFQSSTALTVYSTQPGPGDHVDWNAEVPSDLLPPLNAIQVSDPYIVALAAGPLNGAQHAVRLVLYDDHGGRMRLRRELHKSPTDPDGPNIRAWQLADNGIAMQINDAVIFYHGAK